MTRLILRAAALWASFAIGRGQVTEEPVDFKALNVDVPGTWHSQLHPCPAACLEGAPANWTVYSSIDRLSHCDQAMLFDLAIYNPVDDPDAPVKIRACTAGNASTTTNALFEKEKATLAQRQRIDSPKSAATECTAGTKSEARVSLVELGSAASSGAINAIATQSDVEDALSHVEGYFGKDIHCDSDTTVLFAYARGAVVGVYAGAAFGKASISTVAEAVRDQLKGSDSLAVAQLCGNERNANHVLGLAVDRKGNVGAVQDVLRAWADAECVQGSVTLSDALVSVWEAQAPLIDAGVSTNSTTNSTLEIRSHRHRRGAAGLNSELGKRAECKTVTVVSGDSCGSLKTACGISAADLVKYNPASTFCSTLQPGQRICCSAGDLPDIRPKPNADGTCATYLVVSGDNCSKLAASNGLKLSDIETFNNGTSGTWGWYGCNKLLAGVNICLSKGKPPMPAPVANAVCGPTKPGSTQPTDGKALADINPCPLNVCCNIWGQCGISADFCVEKRAESGNPGTSPPGTNGCVSSCGMDIVNNKDSPGTYARVGYYETWNYNRECLNMQAKNANVDGSYTHIHWAFAEINTADWTVKINDPAKQWDSFKALTGVKRIISFGGWGFSTEASTYDILRQAMSPDHRTTFAQNVASFINKEGIDGVDFDWEYPGATDIPGTPPGYETDGPNYLKFLTVMSSNLQHGPNGKSLSIAAPASYWYLKAFPIKDMAKQLDYIVYMTYDLHGQWDAGNQYSADGCPTGNCLRSHVNLTETTMALAMITKAGVPTYKIMVGESSYGRSFHMTKAGCDGPNCFYTGTRDDSDAQPGVCTDTAGYIANAEIDRIIAGGGKVKSWHDGASNSDLLVYDDLEWVAYMSKTTKDTRRDHWKGFNFAGTIDWAVDLQTFNLDDDWEDVDNEDNGLDVEEAWPALTACTGSYDTLEAVEAASGSMPWNCKAQYTVQALQKLLSDSITAYNDLLAHGYEDDFKTYADAVVGGGNKAIEKFMFGKGKDYFDCIVTETISCCEECYAHRTPGDDLACRYCEDYDCGYNSICDSPTGDVNSGCGPIELRYKNFSMPCLPDYSLRSSGPPVDGYWWQSSYWTLRKDRADPFWGDLYLDTSISQDNIEWKNLLRYGASCEPNDKHCADHSWDYNFPVTHDYTREDVLNPEDVVKNANGKLQDLGPQMVHALDDMRSGAFLGNPEDLVDALSIPVFMVEDAVNNMKKIKEFADKINEEKRKAIILAFLSAIFFFVPIIGEVVGSVAALANVARIIATIGVLGDVATDIYTLLDDKDNMALAIFGLVLAPLAIADVALIGKAASFRREMKMEDVAKLGEGVNKRMDTVANIKGTCLVRPKKKRDLASGSLPMSSLAGLEIPGYLEQDF